MNFEQRNQAIRAIKTSTDDVHPLRKKWWDLCWWIEGNNPFTKFIYVKSAEEYMNMPHNDRTYLYFWYLHAIVNDGHRILGRKADRNAIETFLQYRFPIQYWVRENGFKLRIKIVKAYDEFCYFLNPRQKWLTKKIPNSWCDKVTLVPDVNFAMIVHFVEGEKCFENTDYELSSEGHVKFARELIECYLYIKVRRPALDKQYWNSFPEDEEYTGDYYKDYAETNRLEKELEEQDTKWLTWIVTNRGYLWT
jgi:hypothetical protein